MSEYSFYNLHKLVILCNIFAGYQSPMLPGLRRGYHLLLRAYVFLLNLFSLCFALSSVFGLLLLPTITFQRACYSGILISSIVFVAVNGYIIQAKTREFNDLTDRSALIFHKCITDPLDVNKQFSRNYLPGLRILRYYIVITIPTVFIISVMVILFTYTDIYKYLGFSGDTDLAFPIFVGFEYEESPKSEIVFFIQVCGILCGCRKFASESLLLMYLHLLLICLRHLKHTLQTVLTASNVASPDKSSSFHQDQERNLKYWIILHQDVTKWVYIHRSLHFFIFPEC